MFAQRFDPGRKRRLSESDRDLGLESSEDDKSVSQGSRAMDVDLDDEELDEEIMTAKHDEHEDNDGSTEESDDSDSSEQETKDLLSSSSSDSSSSDSTESESESESDSESDSSEASDTSVSDTVGYTKDEKQIDDDYTSKYKNVFEKFQNATESQAPVQEQDISDTEMHDIAPLPQPELPRDYRLRITTSNTLDWLAKPSFANPEETAAFESFGLSSNMLKNLKSLGFTDAFSVQISVMNLMLNDSKYNKLNPDSKGDILVNASTGSGKTLAYLIPIIESLTSRVVPRVRAIILVPTKPLVNQVKSTLGQLTKGTNLYVMNLKSDISIKVEGDKLMSNEPDIIVSTPGRLVEHITNESISLKSLRYLVIDEADRLLNQSFQNWCTILINKIESYKVNVVKSWKQPVQKLIFSATLTTDAGKLSLLKFYKPRLIIVNDKEKLVNELFSTPKNLSEYIIKFGSSKNSIKPLILAKFLIKSNKLQNVLIFTKSNESSIRLAKLLDLLFQQFGSSIAVNYLNSTNNSSLIRNKMFKDFQAGNIRVLVVTDLIARGIDVSTITEVINYDLPYSSREYVHRVGRTARANNHGNAYSLVFGKGEQKWFLKIMKDVSRDTAIEHLDLELIEEGDQQKYKEALSNIRQ